MIDFAAPSNRGSFAEQVQAGTASALTAEMTRQETTFVACKHRSGTVDGDRVTVNVTGLGTPTSVGKSETWLIAGTVNGQRYAAYVGEALDGSVLSSYALLDTASNARPLFSSLVRTGVAKITAVDLEIPGLVWNDPGVRVVSGPTVAQGRLLATWTLPTTSWRSRPSMRRPGRSSGRFRRGTRITTCPRRQ